MVRANINSYTLYILQGVALAWSTMASVTPHSEPSDATTEVLVERNGSQAPLGIVAINPNATFKQLRRDLSNQVDHVPEEAFQFVRENGVPVSQRQEAMLSVGSGRIVLRSMKERKPSVIEQLAVENLKAIQDMSNLPYKAVGSMMGHASLMYVCSGLLFAVWVRYVLIEALGMYSIDEGHFVRSEWVRWLANIVGGIITYAMPLAICWALFGRSFKGVEWLGVGYIVSYFVLNYPPLVFAWTILIELGSLMLFILLYARAVSPKHSNFGRQAGKILLAYVIVMGLVAFSGITNKVKEAKQDWKKGLWILLGLPAFREFGYWIIRRSTQDLKGVQEEADYMLLVPFLVMFAWVGRFLLTGMNSYTGMVLTVVLQAFQEMILRQTHHVRDKFIYGVRHTKEQTIAKFDNPQYKTFTAHVLMIEQYSEYIAILGASVVVILFYPFRLWFDLGYESYEADLDLPLLLSSTALQVVCELCVDMLCLYVERIQGIDVTKEWNNRFKGYFVCVWLCSTFAFIMFLAGFLREPPECFCHCPSNLTYVVQINFCSQYWNATNATLIG